MPSLRGYGKGDQHVRVVVRTPTHLSRRQKELFKELAKYEKIGIINRIKEVF
jgi:molecular chaperone DnaJ